MLFNRLTLWIFLPVFLGLYFFTKRDAYGHVLLVGIACEVSHLYCYNCQLFMKSLYYLIKSDQVWINSGSMSQVFAEIANFDDEAFKEAYPVHGANGDVLLRMLAACSERNIEVRLVASPDLPGYRNVMTEYDAAKAVL